MTLQVGRWWRLLRAVSIHNISLCSGAVAADPGGAGARRDLGSTRTIETARWEGRGV